MSVSPTLVGRTDELKKTYRLAPESGQSALRVANVAIQIVKSMNPLYADAKHNERLELVSEYKLANRIPRSTSESIEMVYPGSGSIHKQKSRERSHPNDMKVVIACVELCREISNPSALRHYSKREVMQGNLKGAELENFSRDATITSWRQTCTAKMGRDAMSVVDANLKVYGIGNLRISDGSIMPRMTTGNTMAPCVVIRERAGEKS
jgi:choline dehydrogenase-like flavoprotein